MDLDQTGDPDDFVCYNPCESDSDCPFGSFWMCDLRLDDGLPEYDTYGMCKNTKAEKPKLYEYVCTPTVEIGVGPDCPSGDDDDCPNKYYCGSDNICYKDDICTCADCGISTGEVCRSNVDCDFDEGYRCTEELCVKELCACTHDSDPDDESFMSIRGPYNQGTCEDGEYCDVYGFCRVRNYECDLKK